MIEVPSPHDRIVMTGDFQFFTAQELFDHWVNPELLKYWWPQQAKTDPKLGGKYRLTWPDMGWELFGEYVAYDPGKHLAFTWNWSHEPNAPEQRVDIYFSELVDSTRIGVFHGPFDSTDSAGRQGVVEGWIHFGMRLAGLRRTEEQL